MLRGVARVTPRSSIGVTISYLHSPILLPRRQQSRSSRLRKRRGPLSSGADCGKLARLDQGVLVLLDARSFTAAFLLPWVVSTAEAQSAEPAAAPGERRYIRPDNDREPFTLLDRPTRFIVGWPQGALYEADLNIPVHLWSRTVALRALGDQTSETRGSGCQPTTLNGWPLVGRRWNWRPDTLRRTRWQATGCTITFLPHFVIRQLSAGSAPVRTPSFNPGLEFAWYILRASNDKAQLTPNLARARLRLLSFHTRVAHYSNGQSGCLYADQSTLLCDPRGAPGRDLNTVDGSFSTNYVEQEIGYARLRLDPAHGDASFAGLSGAARWSPRGFLVAGYMDDELSASYRRTSLLARLDFRRRVRPSWLPFRGRRVLFRASADGECAPGRRARYAAACRAGIQSSITFPGMYGFGFVTRLTDGWDYYNIGYGSRISPGYGRRHVPTIGIILDHARPTEFDAQWPRDSQ